MYPVLIIAMAPLSLVSASLEIKPTTLLKRAQDGPLPPSPDIITSVDVVCQNGSRARMAQPVQPAKM